MRPAAKSDTLERVRREALAALIPPPRLSVSEWLDTHRVMDRGYPSPFPGPWRTGRTPYLREPLDAFMEPDVETIVLMLSSQIGKTEALMGMLMCAMGSDPGPALFVLPTRELAESMSTDRLALALRTCPRLQVKTPKTRSSDDAVLHKRVNGQSVVLAGANSPAGLSSRPVRYLWCDEIDRWPATTPEGDPLSLATQRTQAFANRRVILVGTPTIKDASRIEDWYDRSDKRKLFSPCPACHDFFVIEWQHVRWDSRQPITARIECPTCEARIYERERAAMIAASEWRATAPPNPDRIRGYWTWAVVCPWMPLERIVAGFLKARDTPEKKQAWWNLTLARSWEVQGEGVEAAALLMRREAYTCDVPAGAHVLTAGIDTQDDRLEALVVGWGPGEEAWIISRDTIPGDPADPATWVRLDEEILLHRWAREAGGTTVIQCALVDALGHRTTAVYSAVVARQHRRLFASIGKDGGDASGQLVSTPKTLATAQGAVVRYIVDASQAKALIYARLRLERSENVGQPQSAIHFPTAVGEAFFSELTAETLITARNKWGVPAKHWARRPGHVRNEALDCLGMALAALRIVAPTPARFAALAARVDAASGAPAARGVGEVATPTPRRPRVQSWDGRL